jgi:hypothetical protein
MIAVCGNFIEDIVHQAQIQSGKASQEITGKEAVKMVEITKCFAGWFAMIMIMACFVWSELKHNELEPEEEEEPPSTGGRLAFAMAIL